MSTCVTPFGSFNVFGPARPHEAKKELEPAEVRDTTMPGSTWNVRTVAVKGTIAAWAGPQETLRDHMQSQTLWGSDANWGWLGFLAPTSSEDATRISQRFNCSPSILVSVCGTTLTSSPVLYRDPTELLRLLSSCDCCHDGQQKESPVSHQPSCAGQVRIRRRLGRQHEDHLNGFMRVGNLRITDLFQLEACRNLYIYTVYYSFIQ